MVFNYIFDGLVLKKITPSPDNQSARNAAFTLCNDYLDEIGTENVSAIDFFDKTPHSFDYIINPETQKTKPVAPSKENQLARSIFLTLSRAKQRSEAAFAERHHQLYLERLSKLSAEAAAKRAAAANPSVPAPAPLLGAGATLPGATMGGAGGTPPKEIDDTASACSSPFTKQLVGTPPLTRMTFPGGPAPCASEHLAAAPALVTASADELRTRDNPVDTTLGPAPGPLLGAGATFPGATMSGAGGTPQSTAQLPFFFTPPKEPVGTASACSSKFVKQLVGTPSFARTALPGGPAPCDSNHFAAAPALVTASADELRTRDNPVDTTLGPAPGPLLGAGATFPGATMGGAGGTPPKEIDDTASACSSPFTKQLADTPPLTRMTFPGGPAPCASEHLAAAPALH